MVPASASLAVSAYMWYAQLRLTSSFMQSVTEILQKKKNKQAEPVVPTYIN